MTPLTPTEKEIVADFARRYPQPSRLVAKVWTGLYVAARRLGMSNEELDSAAWVGVCRAARGWDGVRKFDTFATWKIRASVGREVTKRARETTSSNGVRTRCGQIAETIPDRRDPMTSEDVTIGMMPSETLEAALLFLPLRWREVVERIYGFGGRAENRDVIAASMGVSKQRVWTVLEMSRERLRERLEGVA